jgi:hypothetical protein
LRTNFLAPFQRIPEFLDQTDQTHLLISRYMRENVPLLFESSLFDYSLSTSWVTTTRSRPLTGLTTTNHAANQSTAIDHTPTPQLDCPTFEFSHSKTQTILSSSRRLLNVPQCHFRHPQITSM